MTEPTLNSAPLTSDLPLVRVKMTPQGPHVLAADEQFDENNEVVPQEEDLLPMSTEAVGQGRAILPMSTGIWILPRQSAQIRGRWLTRDANFWRLVISNAGTAGGAADWVVNTFRINDVSQFAKSGDVPADVFSPRAPDRNDFVWPTPLLGRSIVDLVVTYMGLNDRGCPFFGAMVGAVGDTVGLGTEPR